MISTWESNLQLLRYDLLQVLHSVVTRPSHVSHHSKKSCLPQWLTKSSNFEKVWSMINMWGNFSLSWGKQRLSWQSRPDTGWFLKPVHQVAGDGPVQATLTAGPHLMKLDFNWATQRRDQQQTGDTFGHLRSRIRIIPFNQVVYEWSFHIQAPGAVLVPARKGRVQLLLDATQIE